MKIEFWLDYNNPICYKQHQDIVKIMESESYKDLDLLYRSYEMIPLYKPQGESFYDLMSQHYVLTLDEAKQLYPDLPSCFSPVSVFDAHRLSHLAKKYNLAFAYHKALFETYYEDKKDISSHDVLKEIATYIGLDIKEVSEVLSSDQYAFQVDSNRENAILKGIHDLPHIRIDGKVKLSGYHPYIDLVMNIMNYKKTQIHHEHCVGENCDRKKTR